MKINIDKIKEKVKEVFKGYGFIFIIFFAIYLFLGLCMSYKIKLGNIFFGSDSARVFKDLTVINANHYRIKVHPLFLLLIQTTTLFINGLTNEITLSVIIEEALCGSLSVCFLYAILKRLNISRILRTILSIIYGFSFSILIFSTIPESFIFAGLGLISYWYLVTYLIEKKGELSKKERFLLILFGVISFGITLTNYISYSIGLLLILISRYNLKKEFKKIIKEVLLINFINIFLVGILCVIQSFIWKGSPIFYTSILNGLSGKGQYEETLYMDWLINFDKTKEWIKNVISYPFLAPTIELGPKFIKFSSYNFILKIIIGIFFISTIIPIIIMLIKGLFTRKDKKFYYFIFIFGALLFNLILHYIYAFNEAFMYSPHFLFLYLILVAMSINELKKTKIPYMYYIIRINLICNF